MGVGAKIDHQWMGGEKFFAPTSAMDAQEKPPWIQGGEALKQ